MTPDALLAETFRRSDQLLAAWATHAAAAGVVLVVVVSVPAGRADRSARRVLAAAFAFLALANLEGMLWILKQWAAVADLLRDGPALAPHPDPRQNALLAALADVSAAPHPLWVVPVHLVLDAFVLWVALRRRPPAG